MKTVTIAGNIGKDAAIHEMKVGDKVTRWSVAVNDGFGDKKRTMWFDCVMTGLHGVSLPHTADRHLEAAGVAHHTSGAVGGASQRRARHTPHLQRDATPTARTFLARLTTGRRTLWTRIGTGRVAGFSQR
jgi:hypothetical protein